jgi:putative toxin-antitoxin system antitoxin component (TIGR02293 family)
MPVTAAQRRLPEDTVSLLGGGDIADRAGNDLAVHDLLSRGLPSATLLHLTQEVGLLADDAILDTAIGISIRTLQRRRKDDPDALLSVEQSSRTWRFAEILSRAIAILGDKAAAETWLITPAMALGGRRPVDLLSTSTGVRLVDSYLGRMEFGVYT